MSISTPDLSFIPPLPQTFASWRIWKGSVRDEPKAQPVPKKQLRQVYRRARKWNKEQRGIIGSSALRVLEALIEDFPLHVTGLLYPSYETIAKASGLSRSTIARAIQRLKQLGILNWLRRCDHALENGRYVLKQLSNRYFIMPPSGWFGLKSEPDPTPDPNSWGACPMLPPVIEQASDEVDPLRQLAVLESDPKDETASALASLFRTVKGRLN